MRLAAVPLVGVWFAFLALPISGPRNAAWIGAACALIVLVSKLLRRGMEAGPVAERLARLVFLVPMVYCAAYGVTLERIAYRPPPWRPPALPSDQRHRNEPFSSELCPGGAGRAR